MILEFLQNMVWLSQSQPYDSTLAISTNHVNGFIPIFPHRCFAIIIRTKQIVIFHYSNLILKVHFLLPRKKEAPTSVAFTSPFWRKQHLWWQFHPVIWLYNSTVLCMILQEKKAEFSGTYSIISMFRIAAIMCSDRKYIHIIRASPSIRQSEATASGNRYWWVGKLATQRTWLCESFSLRFAL